jgi:hypothetical protein
MYRSGSVKHFSAACGPGARALEAGLQLVLSHGAVDFQELVQFDGVHPTVEGYRLMAEAVMEVFSESKSRTPECLPGFNVAFICFTYNCADTIPPFTTHYDLEF